jgi:hypothetical protein
MNGNQWSASFSQEVRRRVEAMERREHEFPPSFSGTDWALALITIVVSGGFLIAGAGM